MLGNWWFRFRHRKSRAEVISFQLGMTVGRELCILIGAEEAEIIIQRILTATDKIKEDYSG